MGDKPIFAQKNTDDTVGKRPVLENDLKDT